MTTPGLLVSVRDAAEAEAALAGGADLIDVKEPSRGALGRADAEVIRAVVETVNGRAPVSAALGELRECARLGDVIELPDAVRFVKWGLAGLLHQPWQEMLSWVRTHLPRRRVVAVGYADWVPAESPRPADVARFAGLSGFRVFLLDTYGKDGATLFDWLPFDHIAEVVRMCRAVKVRVALAGSLGPAEIDRLRPLRPDWFAVRGAACAGGRAGRIEAERVRALKASVGT